MSKDARVKRGVVAAIAAAATITLIAGCAGANAGSGSGGGSSASGEVTLEFAQWWEPELPAGSLRQLMDQFEQQNPGIKVKLISGPYASTKEQVVAGAAAGTMSDVVGLDGAWISDFAKQGAIADLGKLMSDASYDQNQLTSQVKVEGTSYMLPVLNFVYPMFSNSDLLAKAGINKAPTNRTEFTAAAKAVSALGGNAKGWVMPLSLEAPNGVQNDVMSWAWASGQSMMKDGKPDLTTPEITGTVNYVKSLWDAGVIAPGSFTMKEQDKVEEFTNGRVGMMIDSLAHITAIREKNPKLKFSISAVPAADGFSGKRGIPYASWGIGVAENSPHKAEAFKLIQFLMSDKTNAALATTANAFPGNKNAAPDFTGKDALFKQAFDVYKSGYPANEFVGLPVAEQLMRSFAEQFQKTLSGDQSVDDMLSKTQDAWKQKF